ncbi:CDP-alcohol phosphatidyltransferase family protein [Algihabitans albus]|uniref:CDP-alcohol phosphatidyltransferase family protein n=1 Tax=Algihabitans albus TaxID=2164067 RepID=UPI000E5D5279|nr:CDP-alcohol phosphatidyltransferase family protein [Algihabitans albus]
MLDVFARRLLDRPLNTAASSLARLGIGANALTLSGFGLGLVAVPLLAFEAYIAALILILLNRLADGLDGPLARTTGHVSDLGGFLDIVCDFVFYSAVIFGFALGQPDYALPAAFLIFSFVGTGSSFLAYAIVAAKRGITTDLRGRKSLYYLGGLTEGTETVAFLIVICLFPDWFPWLAWGFGIACWITTATRVLAGWRNFRGS